MGIGYASVNSVILTIDGKATGKIQDGVYIEQVRYVKSTNADIENSDLYNIYKTNTESKVILSKTDDTSSITYEISIFNKTAFDQKFIGIIYDDEFYNNKDIVPVLNEKLQIGDILKSNERVIFEVTFKYSENITDFSSVINELNAKINFEFHYIERLLNSSDPIFDDTGMIPVTIENDGTVKTADLNTDWYSYGEKRWANTVLVTEASRSKYLGMENETVSQTDIIAYYVWIPRFSYQIWTTNAATSTNPQNINIVFESKDTISNGVNVGEYRTMPAFWWNKNNDTKRDADEELSGIWIGKFETSKGSSSNVGTSLPVILPNASSWVTQTESAQFKKILEIAGGTMNTSTGVVSFSGSSVYGLSNTTNSHMLKNSEWAAASYLHHSLYGSGTEIRVNNYYKNSTYMTGCGALTANEGSATTCGIIYGQSSSYPQSSTGNITGIFDMSGGAWDRVMGNYNNVAGSSGFSKFPESKYYDLFKLTALSQCTIEICGGQALFETSEWYSDLSNFISNNSYPWIVRSGGYGDAETAGAFNFGRNIGQSTNLSSMRAALLVGVE